MKRNESTLGFSGTFLRRHWSPCLAMGWRPSRSSTQCHRTPWRDCHLWINSAVCWKPFWPTPATAVLFKTWGQKSKSKWHAVVLQDFRNSKAAVLLCSASLSWLSWPTFLSGETAECSKTSLQITDFYQIQDRCFHSYGKRNFSHPGSRISQLRCYSKFAESSYFSWYLSKIAVWIKYLSRTWKVYLHQ